jgi:tRNA threonylcarbamoyladenosine biosynthesis protein TsaB
MPLILQLETSTEVCSVALSKNGIVLYLAESDKSNSHTEMLTMLIQECMANTGYNYAQLDAIAISQGPGSYTSLRIGSATAKGLCYAANKPLITLDSLKILACGLESCKIAQNDLIVPMIDARRMEVYTAIYNKDLIPLEDVHALILDEQAFNSYDQLKHVCGSGAEKFMTAFKRSDVILHHKKTSATFMSTLSLQAFLNNTFSDVAYFSPEYFKAPNITKSTKKIF